MHFSQTLSVPLSIFFRFYDYWLKLYNITSPSTTAMSVIKRRMWK